MAKVFADPAAIGAAPGHDYAAPPARPSPALPASAYAGVFANDYFGPVP